MRRMNRLSIRDSIERLRSDKILGALFFIPLVLSLSSVVSCSTLPKKKFKRYSFPKNAFIGEPPRPYEVLGQVRTKIDFSSMDDKRDEATLCRNYFNQAVNDLVKRAKDQGGDAVMDVKSVVFLLDGKTELHPQAECSDDGEEGQVLTQGTAIKWTKPRSGVAPMREEEIDSSTQDSD